MNQDDLIRRFRIASHKLSSYLGKGLDYLIFPRQQKAFGDFLDEGYEDRPLISRCCRAKDFRQPYHIKLCEEMHLDPNYLHRKTWEFVFIANALEQYGMFEGGKKGLGFAVGMEPLPSYFASKGCDILATDLSITNKNAAAWAKDGQNSGGNRDKLFRPEICSRETFDQLVKYRDADMNHIPDDIGLYDFCWSSCAIEHVGSLELSKLFLKNMLNVLKPGGIAVHTTEFNLWSNSETIETGDNVIYRRRDLEEIADWYREHGHEIELSFKRGDTEEADMYLDVAPYRLGKHKHHITLMCGPYACTSYGIIVKKGQ